MSSFTLWKGNNNRAHVLANALAFISQLPDTQSYEIEVTLKRKERTDPQCRYLNGVAYKIIGDALGFERDDISEYLCGEYFGWHDRKLPGDRFEKKPIRTTTTDENGRRRVLSTMEFCEYVGFIQRFAAKHAIYIPDPDPMMPDERWRDVA